MKTYTFEIPATCTEIVTVTAESLEDAVEIINSGNVDDSYIPESNYEDIITKEYLEGCLIGEV